MRRTTGRWLDGLRVRTRVMICMIRSSESLMMIEVTEVIEVIVVVVIVIVIVEDQP